MSYYKDMLTTAMESRYRPDLARILNGTAPAPRPTRQVLVPAAVELQPIIAIAYPDCGASWNMRSQRDLDLYIKTHPTARIEYK